MRYKKSSLACAVIAATAIAGTAATASGSTQASSTITIGNLQTLSGAAAVYGQSNTQGAEMAVAAINAAGGVLINGKRHQLALDTVDDQGQTAVGVASVNGMLSQGIHFIIGPSLSTISQAIEPTIASAKSKVILVVSGGTSPELTDGRSNVFVTTVKHAQEALAAAWFFKKHSKGYTRAAILADQTFSALGDTFRKGVATRWQQLGGTITTTQFTNGTSQTDFGPQLLAIQQSHPDVIFSAETASSEGVAIKQAHQLGLNVPFISTAGGSPVEASAAGSSINGNYEITGMGINELLSFGDKYAQGFATKYDQKYSKQPVDLVGTMASAYSAVYAVTRAMTSAKTATNVPELIKAMHKVTLSNMPYLSRDRYVAQGKSKLLFDATGWAQPKYIITVWSNNTTHPAAVYRGG